MTVSPHFPGFSWELPHKCKKNLAKNISFLFSFRLFPPASCVKTKSIYADLFSCSVPEKPSLVSGKVKRCPHGRFGEKNGPPKNTLSLALAVFRDRHSLTSGFFWPIFSPRLPIIPGERGKMCYRCREATFWSLLLANLAAVDLEKWQGVPELFVF